MSGATSIDDALNSLHQGLHTLTRYYRCNDPLGQHDIVIYWAGLNLCDLQVLFPSHTTTQALGILEDKYYKVKGARVSLVLNRHGIVMLMKG